MTKAENLIEITLLRYRLKFKKLDWREETEARKEGNDSVKGILSYALHDVSGLAPDSSGEARKVIDAVPEAIISRVWKVYKGSMPPARRFSTANLYQAPAVDAHADRVQEDEEIAETTHEKALREMEAKFGKQEVAEEAELSRRVLEAAMKDGRTAQAPPATAELRRRRG